MNDRRTITSVETAYNKLTDAQKTFISEAEKATLDAFTARRDYLDANEAEMKANEKAASAVEKLIKALPKAERVDYTDKAEIEKARTAYDELTDDQKKLVSNLDTLTAAEAALRKALDDVAADKSAAEIVIEMIQALPETVVYDHDDKSDEAEIHAAREAYNDLGKVGKNIVGKDNLKLLTNAEKALKKAVSQDTKDQKAAAKVIAKIEKLPAAEDVIVKNKSAISAARKAYDRLNENAKKYADDSAEVIAQACRLRRGTYTGNRRRGCSRGSRKAHQEASDGQAREGRASREGAGGAGRLQRADGRAERAGHRKESAEAL